MRYAFLGPVGTFTEAALRQVITPEDEAVPMTDVTSALAAVRNGEVDRAVVPIENSVEGGVTATLDALSSGEALVLVAETLVPIEFVLAVRPGATLSDITRIATHPHAWAQCRIWASDTVPGVIHVPSTSTAAAAQLLAEEEDPGYEGAIVAPLTAQDYGLEAVQRNIGDNKSAVTRFAVVSRPGPVMPRTGNDKTTLMVQLPDNESGALLTMLEQFAARGVNLSRIESRPTGDEMGRYAFSIDAEGHIEDERLAAALVGLHRICPVVRFLGSYPRVGRENSPAERGFTDDDFRLGRQWVDDMKAGRHGL